MKCLKVGSEDAKMDQPDHSFPKLNIARHCLSADQGMKLVEKTIHQSIQ